MIFLISLFTVGHVIFYLTLSWKWSKIKPFGDGERVSFSVVIPVRNEEENIHNILRDLQNQTYDKKLFEVIVVDDFSDDETKEVVNGMISNTSIDVRIVGLEDSTFNGKKQALTKGISLAKHEIILTTDADCRIDKRWIESYAYAFAETTQIVAGPVSLIGNGFFSDLQKTEFAGLIAFGGVTLSSNNPSMCSGANMGFRKKAFEEVGGYQSNIEIPTGDDEFLLFDIIKKYPQSGRFLKSVYGTVKTKTQPTFQSFVSQRLRWTSKWKHNKNWKLRLTAVLFFVDYLLFLIAVIGMIIGYFDPILLGILIVSRVLANYTLVKQASNFLNHKNVLGPLLTLQLFYPFHVITMGLKSIAGGYTWKGRKYE